MSLRENRIIDGNIVEYDKVKVAIQRLRSFEPPEGYWLAFSGGKDSVALKGVADLSGVKYEAHYSVTTVDPPELVYFIKTFLDVIIDRPEKTMWQLIVEKRMPPLMFQRYCCAALKETKGKGRITLTGVRWAESVARKKNRNLVNIGENKKNKMVYNDENDESRRAVEQCYRTSKTLVNPIIDWSDEEVWEFIGEYKLPYCKLYDEGWKRLGCVGCPLAGFKMQKKQFERWPKYRQIYTHAFQRMLDKREADGIPAKNWNTGDEVFEWWMGTGRTDDNDTFDGQIDMGEL